MKDSWVSETMLQEASLAMEFPASPASQFNNSAAESPPKKSTELPINATQTEEKSCHIVKKHSEIAEKQPPNQNIFCENQPMDTSVNECNDDEEQIVPQIVASCPTSQQNMPEDMMVDGDEHREAANVSSRIMNLGLKDLLNENDHKHGGKVSSNQVNVIANTSTSYQHKNSTVIGNQWYGYPRQEHIIFGPLARSSASFPNTQSSSSISQSQFKERAGSPVITHKKFDYQKTLNLSNSNAPLNLCKRSPSSQSDKPSRQEEEESTPIDLTKKGTNKESDVQCPLQNPTSKYEPRPALKRNQDFLLGRGIRSPFTFGFKSDMDHYTPARMSSFLLPRASSCSPSGSSDHSSSSAISSVEQLRSDPESLVTQDIKPTPEMLSSLRDNISMVPSPLSMGERDVQQMPIIPHFDPAQLNEYYMQQFATKLEGGIYAMPMANFGGFTTTMCHPQPSSPSAKSKNGKPDKMFICQECGAVFKHRHHVVRHMRSHSGERPFRCEECGATFARKCILTNHKRTHTGEKPFICTECGDTFSRKHHLVIHRRTHTGEKPYRCGQCGAAFARSHHLNRHRKTHVKIDTLDYPQFPAGLPLHHMQGLPTMLPILSPSLFPKTSSASAEMHADAFKDKVPHRQQELQEHIQGDIGETSKSESEEPSSCSNNVEVSNSFGAKDPASKN